MNTITSAQFKELTQVLYAKDIVDSMDDVEVEEHSGYAPRIAITMSQGIDMAVQCGAAIGSIPELAHLVKNAVVEGDCRIGTVYIDNYKVEEAA
jgi:hypothetical protein